MEFDISALEMLPGGEPEGIRPCIATCIVSCTTTCLDTTPVI